MENSQEIEQSAKKGKENFKINTGLFKIKSFYRIKLIFSFLSERKKLDIIIYNKKFQNKLFIGIEKYKKISGKYKIGKRNGECKEFKIGTNTLLFEGNYFNGKKYGKGIEYYDNGKIKFEGEYFSGKKWKGKIYNYNGNEEFEIKNGKGFGKESSNNGELIFEGEFFNGERNGKGKEYYNHGLLKFEGEYLNGERWNGKEFGYSKDVMFEKEFVNGKRSGKGKEYLKKNSLEILKKLIKDKKMQKLNKMLSRTIRDYVTKIENGKTNNDFYDERLWYEGEYLNGKRNGKGKEYFNGTLVFEGEFSLGHRVEKIEKNKVEENGK